MNFTLTKTEKKLLLAEARESIASALEKRSPSYPESSEAMRLKAGVFVTLKTDRGALRGCIGTIAAKQPLDEAVRETARSSAFQDPRFRPLTLEEWPEVRIEISVLTPMEKAASPDDVVPGVHGVYLRKGFSSGIFLPQVAVEQGWDRKELLTRLCGKAGLPENAYLDPEAELRVFTALVFSEADYR